MVSDDELSTTESPALEDGKRGTPNHLGPLILPTGLRLADLGGSTREERHQPKKRPFKTAKELKEEGLGTISFSEEFTKLVSSLPDEFRRKHASLLQKVANDPLDTDACNKLLSELTHVHFNHSLWLAKSMVINIGFKQNINWAIDIFFPKGRRAFISNYQSCQYEYLQAQTVDNLIDAMSDDRLSNENLTKFVVNQLLFQNRTDKAKKIVNRAISSGHNYHVSTDHEWDGRNEKVKTTYFSNFEGSDDWNWCIFEGRKR